MGTDQVSNAREAERLDRLQAELEGVVVKDSFEGRGTDEIASNIKLMLALLRELHPAYYEMENFHLLVESLGQRVRNMHNLKSVVPRAST